MSEIKKQFRYVSVCCVALLLMFDGCVMFRKRPMAETPLVQLSAAQYPSLIDTADRVMLLDSAKQNLAYLQKAMADGKTPFYEVGGRQVPLAEMEKSVKHFIELCENEKSPEDLAAAIKRDFDIFRSVGSDGKGKVIFSSYYEPVLEASHRRTGKYQFPLYKRPSDLIDVRLSDFNAQCKEEKIAGMVQGERLVPYHDRKKIDIKHVLSGRGLEIAWLKSRLEVMDLHIEGSGRLRFTDGTEGRAHYAGTNGLQFTGPISHMINIGAIPKDDMSQEKAAEYLNEHPELEAELLSVNKRYTFFELLPVLPHDKGPVGTIGFNLTAERSVAVDPQYVPLGSIAFIEMNKKPDISSADKLTGFKKESRFVLCQDTGGAIKGAGRVDYFAGTGHRAKKVASNTWSEGKLYILLAKPSVN